MTSEMSLKTIVLHASRQTGKTHALLLSIEEAQWHLQSTYERRWESNLETKWPLLGKLDVKEYTRLLTKWPVVSVENTLGQMVHVITQTKLPLPQKIQISSDNERPTI